MFEIVRHHILELRVPTDTSAPSHTAPGTHTHPSTVCPPLKNTYKRTHTSQFAELGGVVDLINDGHQVRAIRNHLVTCAA